MMSINFNIGSRYPVNRDFLRQAAISLLEKQHIAAAELDVTIVGTRKMKDLNERLVGHQGVTDVLSFPHHEKNELHDFPLPPGLPPILGEIVICFPVAVASARKRRQLVDEQLRFYLEHGMMHLLGFHHQDGMQDHTRVPEINEVRQ